MGRKEIGLGRIKAQVGNLKGLLRKKGKETWSHAQTNGSSPLDSGSSASRIRGHARFGSIRRRADRACLVRSR